VTCSDLWCDLLRTGLLQGASSGADTVQFTTWIVVNLQTLQLLL
jgi:hypothetical protein